MSSKQIDIKSSKTLNKIYVKKPGRVDINHLIAKVREQKKKQKKNFVFLFVIFSVIFVCGFIFIILKS